MKKLLIMAGALLALTASFASAQPGIDLNWVTALPSGGCLDIAADRLADQTFLCNSNTRSFYMDGSVQVPTDIPSVIAWGADLDIQVAAATLDNWWLMGSGECHAGALSFKFTTPDFQNPNTCATGLMDDPQALPVSNYASHYGAIANRARYSMGVATPNPTSLAGNIKMQLFEARIFSNLTTGTGACVGCLDPACLVLNHVEVDQPAAVHPPDGINNFYSASIAQWVTWQGGGIGGNGCPAATPTQKATWGQVKSLYR